MAGARCGIKERQRVWDTWEAVRRCRMGTGSTQRVCSVLVRVGQMTGNGRAAG